MKKPLQATTIGSARNTSIEVKARAISNNALEVLRDAGYQHLVDQIGMGATVSTARRSASRKDSPNSVALAVVDGGIGSFHVSSILSEEPKMAASSMLPCPKLRVMDGSGGHSAN